MTGGAFGSLFALAWVALGRRGREPSAPVKFALGLWLLGLAFLAMVLGALDARDGLAALLEQARKQGLAAPDHLAEALRDVAWRGGPVDLGTRASLDGLTLILRARPGAEGRKELVRLESHVRTLLGDKIFGEGEETLPIVAGGLLARRRQLEELAAEREAQAHALAETEDWFDPVLLDDRICPDVAEVGVADPAPCRERFTDAEQAAILAGLSDLPGVRFVDDAEAIQERIFADQLLGRVC